MDEVYERLGEVAGVMTQLVVAEDALEGKERLTKSLLGIIVENMDVEWVSRVCRKRKSEFLSSKKLVLSSVPLCDEEEDCDT